MASFLYVGEQSGARILRMGTGLTQITSAGSESVLPVWETWELIPAGDVGDCLFRSVDLTVKHTNGYSIDVTPMVDGEELTTQRFTGSGSDVAEIQAFISERGNRVAVRAEAVTRTGDLELQQAEAAFSVIRETP